MDSATVLQVGVAIAMLCLLVAALWPKLSCELSDSEQESLSNSAGRSSPSNESIGSDLAGRYGERARQLLRRASRSEKSGRNADQNPDDSAA